MRIGVTSDSHGKKLALKCAVDKMGSLDMLIHLGDLYSDAAYIKGIYRFPVVCVKGNCDIGHQEESCRELWVEGLKLFITHGHQYRVKWRTDLLTYKALEVGANIVLFGHTHMPTTFYEKGVLFMNPGSVSEPRGGKAPTAGFIEITEGKPVTSILTL